jgi:hypothetical protein
VRYPRARDPRLAPLVVIRVDVDGAGRITAVHSVQADRKLVGWPRSAEAA